MKRLCAVLLLATFMVLGGCNDSSSESEVTPTPIPSTPLSGQAVLADVTVGVPHPSSTMFVDPGNDVRVWESQITVSIRNVSIERMALQQLGSINGGDIVNFRLLIDGTQVAQVQSMDANRYISFDLTSSPKTLTTGVRTLRVIADITGGSSRTIQMSLRRATDLTAIDSQYGAAVTAAGTFAASTAEITVNPGTMTVVKTMNSPSGNVADAASDAVLAEYTFTAYGESITVEILAAGFTSSDGSIGSLRNGRILVNGAQAGSIATLESAGGTRFATDFVVNPGSPATIEIRADVFDNDGTNDITAGDMITARLLLTLDSNALTQVSLGTMHVPSASMDGNELTVVKESE